MKALTVRQPWAWAIVLGGKDVENRTQPWSYRGPLAIHAGLSYDTTAYTWPWPAGTGHADPGKQIRGAILGVVDLVDAHKATPECALGSCSPWGWYVFETDEGPRDVVHLVLADPRPLRKPIPCKGRLGLWNVPSEVLVELVGSGVLSGMECA